MLIPFISHILATYRGKKTKIKIFAQEHPKEQLHYRLLWERTLYCPGVTQAPALLHRCWTMKLRKKLSNGCRRKEFNSFSIFVDAERSSAIQTNYACLCRSAFGRFGGCSSFSHFYAREENPKEECQHNPAVSQMVLLQTISFLHCRLAGNRTSNPRVSEHS